MCVIAAGAASLVALAVVFIAIFEDEDGDPVLSTAGQVAFFAIGAVALSLAVFAALSVENTGKGRAVLVTVAVVGLIAAFVLLFLNAPQPGRGWSQATTPGCCSSMAGEARPARFLAYGAAASNLPGGRGSASRRRFLGASDALDLKAPWLRPNVGISAGGAAILVFVTVLIWPASVRVLSSSGSTRPPPTSLVVPLRKNGKTFTRRRRASLTRPATVRVAALRKIRRGTYRLTLSGRTPRGKTATQAATVRVASATKLNRPRIDREASFGS